jgi:hypothetical protein
MLPGFAATMLRLPRTAGTRRQQQPPPSQPPSDSHGSPTEVLRGLPLPRAWSKAASTNYPVDQALEGHAQDVVALLHAGWWVPRPPACGRPPPLPFCWLPPC